MKDLPGLTEPIGQGLGRTLEPAKPTGDGKLMGCRNGIGQQRRQSLKYRHLKRHRWLWARYSYGSG